jgi:WD40 repeat protein
VALSPDGQTLALARVNLDATSQEILFVDIASGATTASLHRNGPQAVGLLFSRDGRTLFACDRDRKTTQIDVPTGSILNEFAFPEPDDRVVSSSGPVADDHQIAFRLGLQLQLRLSPDGRTLAHARNDGLIGLWDVPTGGWMGWLDCGITAPAAIDFSPDGTMIAAEHSNATVLWDLPARRARFTIPKEWCYPSMRFSPDGQLIARSARGHIQFLDAATGRIRCDNDVPATAGIGMVFHPDSSIFIASAFDNSIRLWDTRTGRELLSLLSESRLIWVLVLTPDGRTLISVDRMGLVLAWDLTYYHDRIRRELAYRVAHPDEP